MPTLAFEICMVTVLRFVVIVIVGQILVAAAGSGGDAFNTPVRFIARRGCLCACRRSSCLSLLIEAMLRTVIDGKRRSAADLVNGVGCRCWVGSLVKRFG